MCFVASNWGAEDAERRISSFCATDVLSTYPSRRKQLPKSDGNQGTTSYANSFARFRQLATRLSPATPKALATNTVNVGTFLYLPNEEQAHGIYYRNALISGSVEE